MAALDDPPEPDRSAVLLAVAAAALLAVLGAVPFFAATTFIGDDHLFLAFARYAPNPLVAFTRDLHGGEFYRPLPMVLWWALGRLARGSSAPFAAVALALHATVSGEVGLLVLAVRRDRRAAALATALFFVAPFTREAAYWYAASTDLLATAFGLGAILALLRARAGLAVVLSAAACWSKESAAVVPLLAVVALRAREPELRARAIAKRVAPLLPVAAAYLLARTVVLRGLGGSGDPPASWTGKLVQLASGLVHAITGTQIVNEPLAWAAGLLAWGALLFGTWRAGRAAPGRVARRSPWLWVGIAVAPLLAAPWLVGARYFYLPFVGLAWLAAEQLGRRSTPVIVGVLSCLAGLGVAQDVARRGEVVAYEARLAAARRAVADGLARGFTTFQISAGIKDLDLAVKEDPRFSRAEPTLAVLGDVPASFVALPASRARDLDFLRARPPLPPAGAYRFGEREIVGLARRGDDPTLDEVLAHLPKIRFIRLRLGPAGRVIARDVTETMRGSPDGADADGPEGTQD